MFRSYDYQSYGSDDWLGSPSGFNYVYPGNLQFYRRWERPRVWANGMEMHPYVADTTVRPGAENDSGVGTYPADIIDPNLVVEERLDMWWRYIQGVQYNRSMYAYPLGSAHENYVILDITLKNNGISGVSESAPVLTGQTLTGVIWAQAYDYKNNNAGGNLVQYDNNAMFTDPWGNGNVVLYWWDDNSRDVLPADPAYNGADWGDPQEDVAWGGQLLGSTHIMFGGLFVSASPSDPSVGMTGQPAFHLIQAQRGLDVTGGPYPTDPENQRNWIAAGEHQIPLDIDQRSIPYTAQWTDPATSEATGGTMILGYGAVNADIDPAHPENMDQQGWTLGFNESVNIVQVVAGGGVSFNRAGEIGSSWLEHDNNSDPGETWFTADEITEIKSGQDTVRKAVNLAYWNYYGSWATAADGKLADWGIGDYAASKPAGHDAKYDVPDAPRPPANFSARARTSGTGDANGGIALRWSTEAESAPDFDTGVNDFAGYRIYRQEGSRVAPWEVIADVSKDDLAMANAGDNGVDFAGRVYWDKDVVAGTNYWYAVVAYDDGSQNWAEDGKSLESGRYWTWTGYSEVGVTATAVTPGAVNASQPARFALAQNAPNPFNPTTTINFSLAQTGDASLVIYGPTGQVVRTLVSGSMAQGNHSITWDGKDNFGRPVASGVYIYRLASGDNVAHKRMTLVR
jgi:hypothetical protein